MEVVNSFERAVASYLCECIECGYLLESAEHCSSLLCPECGGQMRRVERPGPGQPSKAVGALPGQANNQQSGSSLGWVILGLTAFTAVLFAIAYKKAKGLRVEQRR